MTTELDVATNSRPPVTRGAARSALAITADQTDWTPAQFAALRQLGLEDAPEGDLAVFRHVCMTTGLDPFRRQIYMIGRNTKVSYYDEKAKQWVNDWTVKYTIQTGIDGFRRNGRMAAKREGATIRVDGPYWQGVDGGGWSDVWLSDQPPAAAKFTIFRDGEAHAGIAMFREFVQTDKGGSPNSMWAKMPANQLAKCAEAQAWRRAYPDDFAGVQLEDAMQVLDGDPVAPTRAHSERVTAGEILAAAPAAVEAPKVQQWQPVENSDNTQVEEPSKASPEPPKRRPKNGASDGQLEQIKKLLQELGVPKEAMRQWVSDVLQLDEVIADVRLLTRTQGGQLIKELTARIEKLNETDTPKAITADQIQALHAALGRERIPEDEHLEWVRGAVGNPDLASFAKLPGEKADELLDFLARAQAADAEAQNGDGQLPIDENGAQ